MPTKATSREEIDRNLTALAVDHDWQSKILELLVSLFRARYPGVSEVWPEGQPLQPLTWLHTALICTGEVRADVVKVTFAKATSWNEDYFKPFKSSPPDKTTRTITFSQSDEVDARALKDLVAVAVTADLY